MSNQVAISSGIIRTVLTQIVDFFTNGAARVYIQITAPITPPNLQTGVEITITVKFITSFTSTYIMTFSKLGVANPIYTSGDLAATASIEFTCPPFTVTLDANTEYSISIQLKTPIMGTSVAANAISINSTSKE